MSQIVQTYIVGQAVLIDLEVRDREGVLTDPTSVRIRVQSPAGAFEELVLEHTGVGRYVGTVIADHDETGTWFYRGEAVNPTTADEGRFKVIPSRFPAPAP